MRFWQVRDPFPQTARNEFKDRWEANAEVARARFADLSDPRAQVVLFFGEETRTLRTTCSDVMLPVDIWYFDGGETGGGEFVVVFLRKGDDVTLWSPHQGVRALASPFVNVLDDGEYMQLIADNCPRGDDILLALNATADWEELRDRLSLKPGRAEDWINDFLASSTDVPEGAGELPASHRTAFPGVNQSRTVAAAPAHGAARQGGAGDHRAVSLVQLPGRRRDPASGRAVRVLPLQVQRSGHCPSRSPAIRFRSRSSATCAPGATPGSSSSRT